MLKLLSVGSTTKTRIVALQTRCTDPNQTGVAGAEMCGLISHPVERHGSCFFNYDSIHQWFSDDTIRVANHPDAAVRETKFSIADHRIKRLGDFGRTDKRAKKNG
jgi:hypothetical protein